VAASARRASSRGVIISGTFISKRLGGAYSHQSQSGGETKASPAYITRRRRHSMQRKSASGRASCGNVMKAHLHRTARALSCGAASLHYGLRMWRGTLINRGATNVGTRCRIGILAYPQPALDSSAPHGVAKTPRRMARNGGDIISRHSACRNIAWQQR